jgi:hypothetical protein
MALSYTLTGLFSFYPFHALYQKNNFLRFNCDFLIISALYYQIHITV